MLTPDQENRVFDVLGVTSDTDGDDFYGRTRELIKDCSAAELHIIASQWNWDAGWEAMQAIAEHPQCDAATASLIFWGGAPGTYIDDWMIAADSEEMDVEQRDMLVAIQKRQLRDGYFRNGFSFDPARFVEPGKQENIDRRMHEVFVGADFRDDISRVMTRLHESGRGF